MNAILCWVQTVGTLHDCGYVHNDLAPRNIARVGVDGGIVALDCEEARPLTTMTRNCYGAGDEGVCTLPPAVLAVPLICFPYIVYALCCVCAMTSLSCACLCASMCVAEHYSWLVPFTSFVKMEGIAVAILISVGIGRVDCEWGCWISSDDRSHLLTFKELAKRLKALRSAEDVIVPPLIKHAGAESAEAWYVAV